MGQGPRVWGSVLFFFFSILSVKYSEYLVGNKSGFSWDWQAFSVDFDNFLLLETGSFYYVALTVLGLTI